MILLIVLLTTGVETDPFFHLHYVGRTIRSHRAFLATAREVRTALNMYIVLLVLIVRFPMVEVVEVRYYNRYCNAIVSTPAIAQSEPTSFPILQ